MNNPTPQSSPALRIEAVSINCIMREASIYAVNGNLLIIAESLTAHYVEYLLLMRLTILLHMTRRNAQSITMITDGRGNVISGGNNGGKSHISYTPYGSIHRTDSSGPDITRFKFTGQEEDKESGLLYYKARYYGRRRWVCDQANGGKMLGRFLQADSVVMPQSTFGMNRYMYVSGSPVNYRDPDGHRQTRGFLGGLIHDFNKGVKNMAHDFNKATGQEHHENKTDWQRRTINRRMFTKFGKWWGRGEFGSSKYENTPQAQALLIAQIYSSSNECKAKYGKDHCSLLLQLSVRIDATKKESYFSAYNSDPFKNFWNVKIRPVNEGKANGDSAEERGVKVVALYEFIQWLREGQYTGNGTVGGTGVGTTN